MNGEEVPCRGKLYYRGYDVEQLVAGFIKDGRFGFEEIVYLLLFGQLPKKEQLTDFCALLSSYRTPAGLLCAGHYHESPLRQYDEFPSAQRFDALFL